MDIFLLSFTISYLFTGLILCSLAAFVYAKDTNNKLNIKFAMYSLTIGWWSIFSIFMINASSEPVARFWDKVCLSGTILIPTTFLHFLFTFLGQDEKQKNIIRANYIVSILFLISLFATPFFVEYTEPKKYIPYFTHPGIIYTLFVIYFMIVSSAGIYLLFNGMRKASTNIYQKRQLTYLFWTSLFGYIGGTFNYMLVYDIASSLWASFGNYLIAIYGLAVAYIILRYHFLNIEVIIKKTLVFAGIFAAAYGIVATFTFLTQLIFESKISQDRLISLLPSIAIIVLILRPLEIFLTKITDRYLFQKEYNPQEVLKDISGDMIGIVDLDKLSAYIGNALKEKLKLENIITIRRTEEDRVYEASFDGKSGIIPADKIKNILTWHTHNMTPLLCEDIDRLSRKNNTASSGLKEQLKELKAAVSIPVFIRNNIYLIILLGDKKSGRAYNNTDVAMLEAVSHQLAMAIENALNFQELKRSQMELMRQENLQFVSVLVKGLAHEIFNPLTPLMHRIEDMGGDEFIRLYEIYERNADRLDKGEEKKFKDAIVSLGDTVKHMKINADHLHLIVDTLKKMQKGDEKTIGPIDIKSFFKHIDAEIHLQLDPVLLKGVDIKQNIETGIPSVRGNPTLLKQILINLYKNACEAMRQSDNKVIDIYCGVDGVDKVRIEFKDSGMGIPGDVMSKIFAYGFSTKGSKGSGIGLNQCKAVIEKFGGSISVKSEIGKGAKFTILIPIYKEETGNGD